jgi:hypothetical protein
MAEPGAPAAVAAEWRVDVEELVRRLSTIVATRPPDVVPAAFGLFSADADDAGAPAAAGGQPRDAVEDVMFQVRCAIDRACQASSNMVADDGATPADRARLGGVLSALYYLQQAMVAARLSTRALAAVGAGKDAPSLTEDDLAAGVARFARMDDCDEMNRVQQLILYLLNCAQARGYQRLHGMCYKRRYTPEGNDTHSWMADMTLRDFVYDVTKKEVNFDMWLNLTCNRGNLSTVCEYLANCRDLQFQALKKDRHVFSFRNGVYLAPCDRFFRCGTDAFRTLPEGLAAAKYFDADFPLDAAPEPEHPATWYISRFETLAGSSDAPDVGDWYAIETPNMQKILDFQRLDEATCRWMYIMLGRLLYGVGELDNWQVIPYIKGMASSGKSTILTRVARMFYDLEDVGTLSNNIERKFGLSALHDKLLFIGPEIKSDIQLEQAEFQSVVSGEALQLAVKFQTAQTVQWSVPGILAGNEIPGWVDNAGSINRRILLFNFGYKVDRGDMELGKKLEAELPALLVKCNRAYLQAVSSFARDNVWLHVPASFHRAKEELSESVNSMVSFVHSSALELGDELYMPLDRFKVMYKEYCTRDRLKPVPVTLGELRPTLMSCNLIVTSNQDVKRYPPHGDRMGPKGYYVLGACDADDMPRPNDAGGADDLNG